MRYFDLIQLNESTFQLDEAVDYIYDNYFRSVVSDIKRNIFDSLTPIQFYSSDLPDNDVINRANELNPVIIIAHGDRPTSYNPIASVINLTIERGAYRLAKEHGSIANAARLLSSDVLVQFKLEFTESKIKGSIYHELVHWLDDSLRNSHLTNLVNKSAQQQKPSIKNLNFRDVALTPYEREAQIHNIVQLKRDNAEIWDSLSFEDMIRLNPVLSRIFIRGKSQGWLPEWRRFLLKRMHREGLLGKQMSVTDKYNYKRESP